MDSRRIPRYDKEINRCVVCGTDISDRARNARLCKSCLAARVKEQKRKDYRDNRAVRSQRAKDYYRENRTSVLQRVKNYQQTLEHKEKRQAWKARNPEKLQMYQDRRRQRYRERAGYSPAGRTCEKCHAAIEVDRGHNAKWCRTCSTPPARTCMVCQNDISGKGARAQFCSKRCNIRYHEKKESTGYTKRCTACREAKHNTEFGWHNHRRRSVCKSCEVRLQSERYYKFTPEQRANRNTLRREREQDRKAKRSPEEKAIETTRARQAARRKLYGPAFDESKWYSNQGGKCAICRTPSALEDLEVDHEHGVVTPGGFQHPRGLLCKSCNFGLLPRYENFFPLQYQDSPFLNAYLARGKRQ